MTIKSFSFLLVFLGACTQWDTPQTLEDSPMSLSTNYITPVIDPNSLVPGDPAAKIYEVQAGTATNKNDIDSNNQKFENKIATLNDTKVDRAGDTMTGTLTINAPSLSNALVLNAATNQTAMTVNGNGTAVAATFLAGAANGAIVAQSSNGNTTVEVTNAGNGIGLSVQGSTSAIVPALNVSTAVAPTGAVPRMGTQHLGYIWFTGADPNLGVDPGADNAQHGMNIAKVFGRAFLGGAPPYVFMDGYNVVATLAVTGLGTFRVTLVRAMADTNYSLFPAIHGAIGYGVSETNIAGRTTSAFEVTVFDTTSAVAGVGGAEYLDILVMGRQ